MKIEPYRIEVSKEEQGELQRRIAATRWPGDLDNANWQYGCQEAALRRILDDWAELDWEVVQEEMNELPHFLAHPEKSATPIHFLHIDNGRPPLLLLPGWPWSFWDFRQLIPSLSERFNLVIPESPGFGFSSPLVDSGVGFVLAADLIAELMQALQYERYGVYGGDWGSLVGEQLAHKYADRVAGLFTSMPFPLDFAPIDPSLWTEEEGPYAQLTANWWQHGTAYFQMHVTRPQTVAYLNDSPVAMAAWIVEKLYEWTDHQGDLYQAYPKEQLLALLSLYWFTGTLGSSARFYAESLRNPWALSREGKPVIDVPTAIAAFPKEVAQVPRAWAEEYFQLVHYRRMERGGHFPAVEAPQELSREVQDFFEKHL